MYTYLYMYWCTCTCSCTDVHVHVQNIKIYVIRKKTLMYAYLYMYRYMYISTFFLIRCKENSDEIIASLLIKSYIYRSDTFWKLKNAKTSETMNFWYMTAIKIAIRYIKSIWPGTFIEAIHFENYRTLKISKRIY
jgi:hypothetical protein